MKWIATVLVGSLALSAQASAPEASTPSTPPARAPSKPVLPLTLELLDRYIQYRREADATVEQATAGVVRQAQDGSTTITFNLKEMKQRDEAVRAKYGLAGEDFTRLDRMVRDISEARFKSESATTKAAIRRLEAQAVGPESPERDMARAMLAFWKKDSRVDPLLRSEREEYGSENVDLVLQREKELKELWVRKDAAAARALGALDTAP